MKPLTFTANLQEPNSGSWKHVNVATQETWLISVSSWKTKNHRMQVPLSACCHTLLLSQALMPAFNLGFLQAAPTAPVKHHQDMGRCFSAEPHYGIRRSGGIANRKYIQGSHPFPSLTQWANARAHENRVYTFLEAIFRERSTNQNKLLSQFPLPSHRHWS